MKFFYLAVAIAGELVGTTFLKYAGGFTKLWPTLGAMLSYGVCFFFFSKALQSLPLSTAYAT